VTFNGAYAFLGPIGHGKDFFAHVSQLPGGTISVGDQATFDVMPDPYKPGRMMATNIRLIDGDEKQPTMKGRAPGCTRSPTLIARWLPGFEKSSATGDQCN
jgi:cold shock CspA family protein